MRDRKQQYIHSKGFGICGGRPLQDGCIPLTTDMPKSEFESQFESEQEAEETYARLKMGTKTLEDAVINLSAYKKIGRTSFDKVFILTALARKNYKVLREISNQFYELSGMYQRLCKYLAQVFRYDWYITPYTKKNTNESKVLISFGKALEYFDNSELKRLFNNIALDIMKNGAYYGIPIDLGDRFTIQQLPADYCRNRFMSGSEPVIELNMKFFDDYFTNPQQRVQIIKTFPKDIQKAYIMYKEGKLKGDSPQDRGIWYMLEPGGGIKINLCGSDCPPLVGTIPYIIDLDEAQELDRKKVMQQLLKIIIQKLPIDKNGNLVFDVDEARDIHNTAVNMLRRAVGTDVLTTFAETSVADMADKNTSTTTDDLKRVERTLFNAAGLSQNLFNTEGNIALEKSVLNDESAVKDLIYQFQSLLNKMIKKFNTTSFTFKASILETSIYNYKDLSKMYKEQTQIGYSKMLPQIALGHSQSSILATATFENSILHLSDIMIPPMMSSTMSNKSGGSSSQNNNSSNSNSGSNSNNQNNQEKGEVGRPEKENEQKTEKTIKNREAMGKES